MEDEAVAFWHELRVVSRALDKHFRPTKLNVLMLGNGVPHLHAHIVLRYLDDADAGGPPRFMFEERDWNRLDDAEYLGDVEALRAALWT